MFLLPLLALRQPQLPDLNQKVTLDMRAVQGVALMKELSRKTGITFEARDAAATDRYLVTVHEVPLTQLMDKLAEAETGVWLHAGDNEYRLVRDRKKIEKEQNDEREKSIKRFTKAFEKYRADLGLTTDLNPDTANEVASTIRQLGPQPNGGAEARAYQQRENELQQQLPIRRYMMKVILGFTPEQLADMPAQSRIVYAVNPTAVQYPLPPGATDAIVELAKEQQYWEEALAKYLPSRVEDIFSGYSTNGRAAHISNAMIAFRKFLDGGDVRVELKLVDSRGHILSMSDMNIEPPPGPPRPPDPPTLPPKPEPLIPLSRADIEMAMLFRNTDRQGTRIRGDVSESIRQVVATPTKVDPFNTFATDIIEGFASSRKQNVVAVLDDRIPQFLADGVTEKGFDPRRIGLVGLAGAEALDFESGFFDMREQRPDRSDKINCDRVSLEQMIAGATSAGHLTVKLAADFVAPLERFDRNYIPFVYIAALFGQDGANALTRNDPDPLRFYGLLDGMQRNRGNVSLSGMTGEAEYLLDKLIYVDAISINVPTPISTPEERLEAFFWNTDIREPTIALGDGVPPKSYLQIDPETERAILAHVQEGDRDAGNRLLNPTAFATASLNSESNVGGTKVLGIAAADREVIKLNFKFSSTTEMNLVLSSYWATSRQTTSLNELPDDVRGPFQNALTRARQFRRNSVGGKNSNSGPP
jgi:hypothetical protein